MLLENTMLVGSYDYSLVVLSVVIAIFASYVALDLAGRVTVARGSAHFAWLAGGASAMGLGIWSMHYIGMLAFRLPIPVRYDWPVVLLSLLAAIFASATALHFASGQELSLWRTAFGSLVMGGCVGAMHYIGMDAMRMGAMCHFDPLVVVLSFVFAVLISFVALRVVFLARDYGETTRLMRVASAIVMGSAIPIMHYTGMAAASFTVSDVAPDLSNAMDVSALGMVGIATVTIMVLGIATLTSAYNRLVCEPRTMRTSVLSVRLLAPRAAMLTFCTMFVFEAAKQAIRPTITIWTSHAVTILFATVVAGVLSFTVLRKEERSKEMLQNSESKYRVLFEDSAEANWLMDEKGFLDCNSAALQMFGYPAGAPMLHPADISPPNQPDGMNSRAAAEKKIAAAFLSGTERFEWLHQRKDGSVFPAEVCLTALMLSGRPRLLATIRNISERKLAEQRVQFLAFFDALTGLPNRTLFQDRLTKALASARRQKDKVALLFLDLDRFKDINDSLGHSLGDLLLQEVAERLKRWGREQDTVARLGGDEFLITLTQVTDVPDVAVAAERLMDAMTAEFIIQGHSLSVSCSIGISIFPEHGADCETLIKNADAAMYHAKDAGRNNFRFFAEDMNVRAVERLALENTLRLALEKKELFLVYQPQMDIATGRITGLEALLRWQHSDLGLVPPDKFIRIAENSGLIVPIGEWVVRTVCRQARKWQDEGLPAVTVAVNVSAVQFRQTDFCGLIRRVLHETGLAPQYLELELTESLLLADADVTLSVLKELKSMGVTLAIDDFGTGYSSFNYLRQFRVSKLKIDGSFIRDVAVNPDDAAITTAIISMAKSLRLKVIAEGVENEAQMSFLRAHHCDEIQGYYFSKPLAVDKVADKLRGDSPEPRKPAEDNRDNKPYEAGISLMSIGLALLVSADPATIRQFSIALRDLSISPDACRDAASAGILLKTRKFDAVIVDLQFGGQSGQILDEVRLSSSNRTAVTFGISDSDAEATEAFRKKSQFVFDRPLSRQSIHKTLKPAYGLILRERRRYFRCPIPMPAIIQREGRKEIPCTSVNISGGGMALSTQVPFLPGESVRVLFNLPDHEATFLAESTICWSKTGHLGVRFISMSDEHKSEIQLWLSQKLEETLPNSSQDNSERQNSVLNDDTEREIEPSTEPLAGLAVDDWE
jgi:diguanylate cyclase (GGDEF)-like protein/PAS domain S-box-containing protein